MRKITLTLLSLGMVVMLIGCGKNTDANTGANANTSTSEVNNSEATGSTGNTNSSENTNDGEATGTDSNADGNTGDATENNTSDSSNQGVAEETTLGNKLAAIFEAGIAEGNIESLANELAEATEYDCMVVDANEGYLNGFTEEIKGFSAGKQFSPMIGSIPLVGYIFETDDPEGLKDKLTSVADPRWNICTEAAETVCVTSGNYVFFTMCPGDEEE